VVIIRLFKKYSTLFIALSLIATISGAALALGPRAQKIQDAVNARRQKTIDRLHALGDKMIDRRVAALNKAITRVNNSKKVATADRDALVSDLNANINNLNTLKATIDGDSEIDSLKNEIKSIVIDYRIYAVVLPRDRGKLIDGRINAILSRIDTLSSKLDTWLDSAKKRGFDLSHIDELDQDFKAKLADAHSQADEAMNQFSAMQPAADLGAAKNHLSAGKTAMRRVRDDLKAARGDLRQIIITFKGLRLGTLSSTQTAE